MLNVDIGKTGVQNVLDLVNANNPSLPYTLTDSNVVLAPVVNTIETLQYNYTPIPTAVISRVVWMGSLSVFIAIAGNVIKTSTDGVNWTDVYTGSPVLYDVIWSTYHNKAFIVGAAGTVLSTEDAVSFTTETSAGSAILSKIAVSSVDGRLITASTANAFYVSTDNASSWTTKSAVNVGDISTCIYIPQSGSPTYDLFVFAGASGVRSYDALTDTFGTLYPTGTPAYNIAYSAIYDRAIATINGGVFLVCENITETLTPTWTEFDPPANFREVVCIESTGEFVLYGALAGYARTVDAISFTTKQTAVPIFNYMVWVESHVTAYVISSYMTYTSTNLTDWDVFINFYTPSLSVTTPIGTCLYDPSTEKTIFIGVANVLGMLDAQGHWTGHFTNLPLDTLSIDYSPTLSRYVVGASGATYYSSDLITWTSEMISGDVYKTRWVGDLEFFVQSRSTGIWTSPDGITWTHRVSGVDVRGGVWSPELELLVIVGMNGYIGTSPDGINFTTRTSGTTSELRHVEWSPTLSMFLIGGAATVCRRSTNGITWDTITPPGNQMVPLWISDLHVWVAAVQGNTDAFHISADAVNWTPYAFVQSFNALQRPTGFIWNPIAKRIDVWNRALGAWTLEPVIATVSHVSIEAIVDAGYSGTSFVSYYRPTLVNIAGDEELLDPISLDTALYDPENRTEYDVDSLARIADALGVRVDELYVPGRIPVPAGDTDLISLRVKIKYDSYIYSGGIYVVKVIGMDYDTPLITVITETILDGFAI